MLPEHVGLSSNSHVFQLFAMPPPKRAASFCRAISSKLTGSKTAASRSYMNGKRLASSYEDLSLEVVS